MVTYDRLWKDFSAADSQFSRAEAELRSREYTDEMAQSFVTLYARRSALLYRIEKMQEMLEGMLVNVQKEEKKSTDHRANLDHTAAVKEMLNTKGVDAWSPPSNADALDSMQSTPGAPDGQQDDGRTDTNQGLRPSGAADPFKAFLTRYHARLQPLLAQQRELNEQLAMARAAVPQGLESLQNTIKKLNSKSSVYAQRRLEAQECERRQQEAKIHNFQERLLTSIESVGTTLPDNIYKVLREKQEGAKIRALVSARQAALEATRAEAQKVSIELAQRELEYVRSEQHRKKALADSARHFKADTRNQRLVRAATGIEDPYSLIARGNRPAHLREPVSRLAKNVVPLYVGLGLPAKAGKSVTDISTIRGMDAAAKRAERLAFDNRHNGSRSETTSFLEAGRFFSNMPKQPDDVPLRETDLNAHRTSSRPASEQARNRRNASAKTGQPATPQKGKLGGKKDTHASVPRTEASSDDDDSNAYYATVPKQPRDTFLDHNPSGPSSTLPVVKLHRQLASPLGRLSGTLLPSNGVAPSNARGSPSEVFRVQPNTINFYDYAHGVPLTTTVMVVNTSAHLASFRIHEPEASVLHLFKFSYTPAGNMAPGCRVPCTITFTPSQNPKECLRNICTIMELVHATGTVRVPIVCHPACRAAAVSSSEQDALRVYKRCLESPAYVYKAATEHINADCAHLLTLITLPHGTQERRLYITNAGASACRVSLRLRRAALLTGAHQRKEVSSLFHRLTSPHCPPSANSDRTADASCADTLASLTSTVYSPAEIAANEQEIQLYDAKAAEIAARLRQEHESLQKAEQKTAAKTKGVKASKEPELVQNNISDENLDEKIARATIDSLGERPTSLASDVLERIRSLISFQPTVPDTADAASSSAQSVSSLIAQIAQPVLLYLDGSRFDSRKHKSAVVSSMRDTLSDNFTAEITQTLTEERGKLVQDAADETQKSSLKGRKQSAPRSRTSSQRPGTDAVKDQSDSLADGPQDASLFSDVRNPDVFAQELAAQRDAAVAHALDAFRAEYSVERSVLNVLFEENIGVTFTVPARSILYLPVIHTPTVSRLDAAFVMSGAIQTVYSALDVGDPDRASAESASRQSVTLFCECYTTDSPVYLKSEHQDMKTCFYGETYNTFLSIATRESTASRRIHLRVPTLLRAAGICTLDLYDASVVSATGDLRPRIQLKVEGKPQLSKLRTDAEKFVAGTLKRVCTTATAGAVPAGDGDDPTESWADIRVSATDSYPPTLAGISLGADVRSSLEALQEQSSRLDDLRKEHAELCKRSENMDEQIRALQSVISEKQAGKASQPKRDKKAPAPEEELVSLEAELAAVRKRLIILSDNEIPILTESVRSLSENLSSTASVGGYMSLSFNIEIRALEQPEPLYFRLSALFTSNKLDLEAPYTNADSSASPSALDNVSTTLASTVTRRTGASSTFLVRAERPEESASMNLGNVLMYHRVNVPLRLLNRSALPQHVCIAPSAIPGVTVRAGPDNGVFLLYPGQDIVGFVEIYPEIAKKFVILCMVESEFGPSRKLTICAQSIQGRTINVDPPELAIMALSDTYSFTDVQLKSTVNKPSKWAISPSFLTFMSTNFQGFLSIAPSVGILNPGKSQKLSVKCTTTPDLVLRLIDYVNDLYSDQVYEDIFDGSGSPAACVTDESQDAYHPVKRIMNYRNKANQFLFVSRRQRDVDPDMMKDSDDEEPNSDDEVDASWPATATPAASSAADDQLVSRERKFALSTRRYVNHHITVSIPIITDGGPDEPFFVLSLNFIFVRPLLIGHVVPDAADAVAIVSPESQSDMLEAAGNGVAALPAEGKKNKDRPSSGKSKKKPVPDVAEAKTAPSHIQVLEAERHIYADALLRKNPCEVLVSMGRVPLGSRSRRRATLTFNLSLPEVNNYIDDTCRFLLLTVPNYDADIAMMSCIEEAHLSVGGSLNLTFEFLPRHQGYQEETFVIQGYLQGSGKRLNNVRFIVRGIGSHASLNVRVQAKVFTDVGPLPIDSLQNSSSTVYTETPPIWLQKSNTYSLPLALENPTDDSFEYTIKQLCTPKSDASICSIIGSNGILPGHSNTEARCTVCIDSPTTPLGSPVIFQASAGDVKRLVCLRVFASTKPAFLAYRERNIVLARDEPFYLHCACCESADSTATFTLVKTTTDLADVVVSPSSLTVSAGTYGKISLTVSATHSTDLGMTTEGFIHLKVSCGSYTDSTVLRLVCKAKL